MPAYVTLRPARVTHPIAGLAVRLPRRYQRVVQIEEHGVDDRRRRRRLLCGGRRAGRACVRRRHNATRRRAAEVRRGVDGNGRTESECAVADEHCVAAVAAESADRSTRTGVADAADDHQQHMCACARVDM